MYYMWITEPNILLYPSFFIYILGTKILPKSLVFHTANFRPSFLSICHVLDANNSTSRTIILHLFSLLFLDRSFDVSNGIRDH